MHKVHGLVQMCLTQLTVVSRNKISSIRSLFCILSNMHCIGEAKNKKALAKKR